MQYHLFWLQIYYCSYAICDRTQRLETELGVSVIDHRSSFLAFV